MHEIAQPLRVLLVEDNPDDAELILRELRHARFAPEAKRVDTEVAYLAALSGELDIILSDYAMPQFSGLRALELLNERRLNVPFIIISGTIGEEMAVTAMRSGAADYLLKDRLTRLGQAVEHALEGNRNRRERRQAQETFEKLRLHHELILNCAGEGIQGLDLKGDIVFVNPKACELLGWEESELLGLPAHTTIHHHPAGGKQHAGEECAMHASVHDGMTRRVTNDVFWRKDGTSFRVDYISAPMKDRKGEISGAIVTFRDITEQFMAEARLKLQEQQYRLLFQTNPNPMWVFDTATSEILAANEAAIARYGYSEDEFLKLSLRDLRPAEDVSESTRALSSPSHAGYCTGEFRHMRKDRSLIDVEVYSSPVVWDGKAARMVTGIDVTERKRGEERLREQADIIQRARDAIIVRDFGTDRVTVWNRGAEDLYGWTASEAIGRPLGDLIFADPKEREVLLEQLIASGEFHGEIKHRAKNGRQVIVDSRATLVRGDNGAPRLVLGINTDITEKKTLELQLLRAQRLESIGTLASGVAHDLNNVLTPIIMCAEMLEDDIASEEGQSKLSLIGQSAQRGAAIVNQVLTFARGVEGERVAINPRHLIEEMVDIAHKTFPKSIEVTARYSEELWTVEGDPTQLHQVLVNLSVNARDAMTEGGSLRLSAENIEIDESYAVMQPDATKGPHVLIEVADTGTGISPAVVDKIFDPFFTTKGIGKGTGLGLSTALGIVKSHSGFLTVSSGSGRGTTFKVFLPAAVGQRQSAQDVSAALMHGSNELVLLVDDEESVRRVTRLILEKHRYRILEASDGPEAVATFASNINAIRIVLTDIMLPYMDGMAVIRAITKMKPDAAFLVSTGQGDDIRLSELQSLGIRHVLAKPYDTATLLLTLHKAIAGNA